MSSADDLKNKIGRMLKEYRTAGIPVVEKQLIELRGSNGNTTKLTNKALNAFNNDDIRLVYPVDENIISTVLPILPITLKTPKVYMFSNAIGSVRNELLTSSADSFEALLISAYIALLIRRSGYGIVQHSDIITLSKDIYVQLVDNVINSLSAIRSDKVLFDTTQYILSKFFLTSIINLKDYQMIENISIKGLNYLEQDKYEKLRKAYDAANIKTFNNLLQWLSTKVSKRFSGVNPRSFLDKFIRSYNQNAFFAIDNYEYLLFIIMGSILNIPQVSKQASTIVRNTKSIARYIPALNSVV
jgi:hypothetical protein